jgi:nucleotide-binding universal stress UspA family protein
VAEGKGSEMAAETEMGKSAIVVGVDGSEGAQAALLWAAAEAVRRHARLDVVHAWIAVGGSADAEKLAGDAASTASLIYPKLDVRIVTPQLSPSEALIEASDDADLLVVGPRGLGGFRGLLLGSVSHQCIEHARCSVVVIHSHKGTEVSGGAPRVVVGVDGSPGSDAAVDMGADEASLREGVLQIVHAWQFPPLGGYGVAPPEGYEGVSEQLRAEATERALRRAPELKVESFSRFGATVPTLVDAAVGADLLLIGARGHGGFSELLLGSTAQACARSAPCPVVVVRSRHSAEPAKPD